LSSGGSFSSPWGRVAMGAVGLVLGMLLGGPPLALCGSVAGLAIPGVLAARARARRLAMLEAQLAEAVGAAAAALRSGLSLSQSIRFAAEEGDPPVSDSMLRVVEREALGVPLEDSLERWALEERLPDVRLVAGVLQLHHRVGGDSPVVLDQVARTLRLRRAAARELRSLTAQSRLSGAVLGLLPVGFFAFMSVVSRHDVQTAYRSPAGLASIVTGLVLDAGAFLWIRKLLTVRA
jgi:tight adherence protein B